MTSTAPPHLTTWMLAHLMPADHDDALAGDLLESFRAGRSRTWYWHQVMVAIAIQWLRTLANHWPALIFAALWGMISPAWSLVILRLDHLSNFVGPIWRLPWPWSTVCMIGFSTAEALLFIWTGVLIYSLVTLRLFGSAKHWRIARSFVLSVAGYILAVGCLFGIVLISAPPPTGHGVDWRTLTMSGVITNFEILTTLARLPYIIATVCAIWGSIPTHGRRNKTAE